MKAIAGTLSLSALVIVYASLFAAPSVTPQGDPIQRDTNTNVLFVKNCASCHGKDGRAKTFKARFNHARNLTDSNWQAAMSDEHIYDSILKGKGKMPAFEGKLPRPDIAALVTYVRLLKK